MQAEAFRRIVTADRTDFTARLIALLDAHGIRYCLAGGQAVNAYAADEEEVRINRVLATVSDLFYAENSGLFEFIRFPDGLQPGRAVKKTITIEVPRRIAGNISAFSVTSAGSGSDEFAEQMLASPLVSPQTRSALAAELSMRNRKQYSFLNDAGSWVAPPGFENLPQAPRTQGSNTVRFDRERIARDEAEVKITNDAAKNITINLMGNGISNRIVIPPQSSNTLTVRPGYFSFTATASGVTPLTDVETFEAGYRYDWRFWISTRYH